MCKVKIAEVVQYPAKIQASRLVVVPLQMGPQVINPGYLNRADKLANVVVN